MRIHNIEIIQHTHTHTHIPMDGIHRSQPNQTKTKLMLNYARFFSSLVGFKSKGGNGKGGRKKKGGYFVHFFFYHYQIMIIVWDLFFQINAHQSV